MAASFICRRYVLNDHDLSDAFDMLDMDRDGELSRAEVAALLRTIKVEPDRNELNLIFDEIGVKNTGKIRKTDFLEYMKCPMIHQITVRELEQQFRQYDRDNDGSINLDELGQILSSTAGISDKNIVRHVFQTTDSDNDGLINFDQFLELMRS
ncbi:EF hand [Aphelenchoides fujianensis]|nr:EF hand [Aphelenchoides fujianensis]KAI6239180.1 EF hand [Aphelenchoides fujianensis]